jgi:hypothetical protein
LGAACVACKTHKYRCDHTGNPKLETMTVIRPNAESEGEAVVDRKSKKRQAESPVPPKKVKKVAVKVEKTKASGVKNKGTRAAPKIVDITDSEEVEVKVKVEQPKASGTKGKTGGTKGKAGGTKGKARQVESSDSEEEVEQPKASGTKGKAGGTKGKGKRAVPKSKAIVPESSEEEDVAMEVDDKGSDEGERKPKRARLTKGKSGYSYSYSFVNIFFQISITRSGLPCLRSESRRSTRSLKWRIAQASGWTPSKAA